MKRNGQPADAAEREAGATRRGASCVTGLALVALLASSGCAPEGPTGPAPHELTVLSYNLRHNVDFYEERMELMADGIAALAPDVVGLQEIEIAVEQGQVLADMIEERDPSLVYELRQVLKPGAAGVLSGEGVGIMSRYPMDDVAILEMEEGRVSLFARLPDVEGHAIAFVSTHLTSDGTDAMREKQARDTVAFLEEHAAPDDARVLVGDMNAVPDTPAIVAVTNAGYTDTWVAAHHGDEMATGNTSPVVLGTDNPPQDFRRRIDYVFARDGASRGAHVTASEVVLDEPRADGLYPSDHLGVLSTLRLESLAAAPE